MACPCLQSPGLVVSVLRSVRRAKSLFSLCLPEKPGILTRSGPCSFQGPRQAMGCLWKVNLCRPKFRPLIVSFCPKLGASSVSQGTACGATASPSIPQALGGDLPIPSVLEHSTGTTQWFHLQTLIRVSQQEALLSSPLYQEKTEAGGRAPWVHTANSGGLGYWFLTPTVTGPVWV